MAIVKFLNHASVLIQNNEVGLLSDPWYFGTAFHEGWALLYENSDAYIRKLLANDVSHIWISHEHPDHFSVGFFKKYGEFIRSNHITLLFQETSDRRVVKFLQSQNFILTELPFEKSVEISSKTFVTCIKDGFYDSGLFFEDGETKILNLNDCEVTTVDRCEEVHKVTGDVDILLTQFSYAAWKGGPDNSAWRKDAAKSKLATMELQIQHFQPRVTIPFASFVKFNNENNVFLNDCVNTPSIVDEAGKNWKTTLKLLKPGETLDLQRVISCNEDAIKFWTPLFQYAVEGRSLTKYESVGLIELEKSFDTYCNRVLSKNAAWLMKLTQRLHLFGAFQPSIVSLHDLKIDVEVDYVNKIFKETNKTPDIKMHSASLNFIFMNGFGFDTLTVNGCFEECNLGGFEKVTKNLAIENLNNLGIHFNLKIVFNWTIISIFFERMNRVRKKIRLAS